MSCAQRSDAAYKGTMNKSREDEIKDNIELWEAYLEVYEFNKRWNIYQSIIKRVSSGHKEINGNTEGQSTSS